MKLDQSRDFFPLLDAIRGIAAVLVLVRHAALLFGFLVDKSYLAVDLFFVLSGVVLSNAYASPLATGSMGFRQFTWIRLVRLYPLYLLGLLLGISTLLVAPVQSENGARIAGGLIFGLLILPRPWPLKGIEPNDPAMFPFNNPSWSLFYELAINFLYARIVKFLSIRWMIIILIVSAFGMAFLLAALPLHKLDAGAKIRHMPVGIVRVTFGFVAGLLVHQLYQRYGKVRGPGMGVWWRGLLVCTAVCILLCGSPTGIWSPIWDFIAVVFCFPPLVYAGMGLRYSQRTTRLFALAGVASYSIYVLHYPALTLLEGVQHRYGFELLPKPWLGIAFTIVLFVLSYFLDRYYDIPVRKLLRKRKTPEHRPESELVSPA